MCHSNRLTRVACWLADYPEWLQFCWDFVKPPRNDEIALQHFFLACSSARIFFSFLCAACNFFLPTSACRKVFFKITHPPPPPQELNGRPLSGITSTSERSLTPATSVEIRPGYQTSMNAIFEAHNYVKMLLFQFSF